MLVSERVHIFSHFHLMHIVFLPVLERDKIFGQVDGQALRHPARSTGWKSSILFQQVISFATKSHAGGLEKYIERLYKHK